MIIPPRGERVHACFTTSLVVVGPWCNLTVGKSDEHTKFFLSSLTQKFIRYYNYKVVVERNKQCMKTESPALAGQRKIKCHEEKENRDRS